MDPIIPLTPTEIHVWLAFYDEITEERLHSAYRDLLNAVEKEQEPRFFFERDRRRYLVTRALVRTVLSRYVPIDPRAWVFSTNAYGRPDIVNEQARDACLSFNISHTHSLIVLGVTRGRALGVDVENVRAREVSIDIADHYFAPQEVAALTVVPPHQQQYRFFEYWTFKEAYIKARGMGLSLPLDKFSFYYPDDHAVEIAIHPDLDDDAARWQFWQFRPASDYLVAICAERIGAQSPRLIVRKAIPMLGEQLLAAEFLRVSNTVSTRHE
ncbi:MAG TPA: 4'-phosphopantetheinyl transferase superfamily protein [Terriglobia bacterium]|nr:4'-phosphopantetheinyl transferase superfamily protein [Terriglobia bacterium]